MAVTFQAVNAVLSMAGDVGGEDTVASPTTPKPKKIEAVSDGPAKNNNQNNNTTPTRASFATALSSQKPLPTSPFPESVQMPDAGDSRRDDDDDDDVDMGESDKDGMASDDESVGADGSRSGKKKKKSQRFYCNDYPPCNLSFTRSEHLARHIRKHTGERPFQCHCSRRFSRLDNLRQHAQTVHVNEDIPIDSLAATGARFQRQMRTERARQAGGRARAATSSTTMTGPTRGHAKSLSTSSLASVSSQGSAYGGEARRRPPPLVMADARGGPYLGPTSPSDFSTPTSATFSTGQSSPKWGSGVASPTSSHSRPHSMYQGPRTPARRLSVPSGGNPFQSPHGQGGGIRGPLFGPAPTTDGYGLLASPPSSSAWSRRGSGQSTPGDEAWRRRTWHPDTHSSNHASRLSHVVSSSQFAPRLVLNAHASSGHSVRLPGIESFDPILSNRQPSPMMIDSVPLVSVAECPADERRWDATGNQQSLHGGLNRLDINTRDSAGTWASEASSAVMARAEAQQQQQYQPQQQQQAVRFGPPAPISQGLAVLGRSHHQHALSAPSFATSTRESKRHGWQGLSSGHPHAHPHAHQHDHVQRMVHPNVAQFGGFPARDPQPPQRSPKFLTTHHAPPSERSPTESLGRLQALVAAATSEGAAAAAS